MLVIQRPPAEAEAKGMALLKHPGSFANLALLLTGLAIAHEQIITGEPCPD
jgi:hypothetical protein